MRLMLIHEEGPRKYYVDQDENVYVAVAGSREARLIGRIDWEPEPDQEVIVIGKYTVDPKTVNGFPPEQITIP